VKYSLEGLKRKFRPKKESANSKTVHLKLSSHRNKNETPADESIYTLLELKKEN
jgi:hypothetical protein